MLENEIGTVVVQSAISIHRELGPGLLESVYEMVMFRVISGQGMDVQRQVPVSVSYLDLHFEAAFRADLIVEGKVILEIKSVEKVLPGHLKQLQTYLKLSDLKLGYLLNFNDVLMKSGITRVVNRLPE